MAEASPFHNERAFTRWVLKEARARGWLAAHFGNSVRYVRRPDGSTVSIADKDAAGFPDLVLARERLVVAELKMAATKPTPAQLEWLAALRTAGVETHLWRPEHRADILAVLEGAEASGTRLFGTGAL